MSTTSLPPFHQSDESDRGESPEVDRERNVDREESTPAEQETPEAKNWPWLEASPGKLAFGLLAGIIFGFLLQKGGVAKFDILQGVLLLENFVVVKVMLAAIIVGMIGSYLMRRAGMIELQIKEAHYAANTIGGLLFGAGFALLAYCPGTNAAALGQGNADALVGLLGLVVGSYVFALSSKYTSGSIKEKGKRGKITVADLLGVSQGTMVLIAAPLLVAVLIALEAAGY